MLTIIPQKTIDEIPINSSKIIAINNKPGITNYNDSYKYLLSNDYKIESDNKEMGYILASKMDVGDTNVRLNIVCSDNQILITCEWKPGMNSTLMASSFSGTNITSDWNNAKWTKQYDKPNIAFAKAAQFAEASSIQIIYK
jgi:hypothetical protein